MGRGKGRGKTNRNEEKKSGAAADSRDVNPELVTNFNNAEFEAYYKLQNIITDEEDWKRFMKMLAEPLPTTLRVTSSRTSATDLNTLIKEVHVPFLSNVVFEGNKLEPPTQLTWYPGGLAWQIDVAKRHIRKSPEFRKFQDFLVYETEAGNISRQEAVSMIPPLLMDVQPEHAVLDMCAAPGSKSAQILEAIHQKADDQPTGVFIANDSDLRRCHMLVHQSLQRIGSPNMMVTNLDATRFGDLKIQENGYRKTLKFDRILADVPCSGDGTLRKNFMIWRDWKAGNGMGLHPLQLRILQRGIQLLKPGGRLVYSTCSLNPIENEAVVSAALSANSDMSIIDVSKMLPELKRRPGLTTWKVINQQGEEQSRPETADAPCRQWSPTKDIAFTVFPSGNEIEQKLDRCLRLYPHDQNTGAFFVAVLEKAARPAKNGNHVETSTALEEDPAVVEETSTMPIAEGNTGLTETDKLESDEERPAKRAKLDSNKEDTVIAVDEVAQTETNKKEKKPARDSFKEEPYTYLSAADEEMRKTMAYFHIKPDFDFSNLLVRNKDGQALRTVYVTSPLVRNLVTNNDYQRMRLVSCGVKVLIRQDAGKTDTYKCRWRLLGDGLSYMQHYVGEERIVNISIVDFRRLLEELYVPVEAFSEDFQSQIQDSLREGMILPMWKAPNSISLMIDKQDKSALAIRLFGSDITPNLKKGRKSEKTTEVADALPETPALEPKNEDDTSTR